MMSGAALSCSGAARVLFVVGSEDETVTTSVDEQTATCQWQLSGQWLLNHWLAKAL